MKKFIIGSLIFLIGNTTFTFANESNIWYRFDKKDLVGFKDSNGNIKIKPSFTQFITVRKFDKIMAVMEEKNDKYESYYLTKSGKKIKVDMFMRDNTFDCEREGFIRFKSGAKLGLLNENGDISIPPIYDNLSNVNNNLLYALEGATRKKDGEYTLLTGGISKLIDTKNNVLIEKIKYMDENINLYSIIEEKEGYQKSEIRDYFKGKNEKIYSFINYEKEFKQWFDSITKEELKSNMIRQYLHRDFTYIKEDKNFIFTKKDKINPKLLNQISDALNNINHKGTDYFVSLASSHRDNDKEIDKKLDNCAIYMIEKYPEIEIRVNLINKKGEHYQNSYSFIKVKNGYQLLDMTIKI